MPEQSRSARSISTSSPITAPTRRDRRRSCTACSRVSRSMQNGTRKGGTVQTKQMIYSSPGFEDLWQLHWSYNAGTEYNPRGPLHRQHRRAGGDCRRADAPPPGGGRGGPAAPGGGAPPAPGAARSATVPAPHRLPPAPARRRPVHRRSRAGSAARAAAGRSGRAGQPGALRPLALQAAVKAAAARGGPASRTPVRRSHQGVRAGRRHLHRHEHAQRIQQDLQAALASCLTSDAEREQPASGCRRFSIPIPISISMSHTPVLDSFRLDGKVALVTGGARGLGLTMATALAEAGADVALSGRSIGPGEEAASEIATAPAARPGLCSRRDISGRRRSSGRVGRVSPWRRSTS